MHAHHVVPNVVASGMSKHLTSVLLATVAVALVAVQSVGLFGESPTLTLPSCFPFIVLTLIGVPRWVIPLLCAALFVAWNPGLLRAQGEVPARTVALWLATTLLSVAYFVVSWRAGVSFDGFLFTATSLAVDLIAFGICSLLLRRARVNPSFGRSLALQVTLFVWISTYAFPYLGSGVIGR
jgi:hypothetical protein